MRTKLRDWELRLQGERVLFIGSAHTDVDYEALPDQYENVVLVNLSIALAPLFSGPQHRVFTFSWHMNQLDQREEFNLPRVIPAIYEHDEKYLPEAARDKALNYTGINYEEWTSYVYALHSDERIRNRVFISESNELHSHGNTTLLALHFLYHAGVKDIHAVGAHDIVTHIDGGAGHYDKRLKNEQGHTPGKGQWYVLNFVTFCHIMGINHKFLGGEKCLTSA